MRLRLARSPVPFLLMQREGHKRGESSRPRTLTRRVAHNGGGCVCSPFLTPVPERGPHCDPQKGGNKNDAPTVGGQILCSLFGPSGGPEIGVACWNQHYQTVLLLWLLVSFESELCDDTEVCHGRGVTRRQIGCRDFESAEAGEKGFSQQGQRLTQDDDMDGYQTCLEQRALVSRARRGHGAEPLRKKRGPHSGPCFGGPSVFFEKNQEPHNGPHSG